MQRFACAPEYVVHHLNLRRTFAGRLWLAWCGTQTLNGPQLGFERNLHSMQNGGLDFILFHDGILPEWTGVPKSKYLAGCHTQVRMSINITTYVLQLSKLQSPHCRVGDSPIFDTLTAVGGIWTFCAKPVERE